MSTIEYRVTHHPIASCSELRRMAAGNWVQPFSPAVSSSRFSDACDNLSGAIALLCNWCVTALSKLGNWVQLWISSRCSHHGSRGELM